MHKPVGRDTPFSTPLRDIIGALIRHAGAGEEGEDQSPVGAGILRVCVKWRHARPQEPEVRAGP